MIALALIVLSKLVSKLDRRAGEHSVASKCSFKKKERIVKSPSKFPVPENAPKWAISSSSGGQSSTTAPPKRTNRRILEELSDEDSRSQSDSLSSEPDLDY